jgi:hypothetical protein
MVLNLRIRIARQQCLTCAEISIRGQPLMKSKPMTPFGITQIRSTAERRIQVDDCKQLITLSLRERIFGRK